MKTMNQNFFPVFQPNEILTHNALNNSFDYLNEQVALTRANLIGIGIVCGLNVVLNKEEGNIYISKGCGITSGKVRPVSQERASCDIHSGGHYIALEKDTAYEYYREIRCDCLSDSILFGKEIYELASISSNDDSKVKEMKYEKIYKNDPLFSKQLAVVLYYESKKYSQLCGSCGGQSYTSPDNVITIRPLLVVIPAEPSDGDAKEEVSVLSFISPLQRLGVKDSSVADIYSGIEKILRERVDAIGAAITKAKSIFKEILKENVPSDISEKIIPKGMVINQNHYDFIRDLTEAYEEFRRYGEEVLLNHGLSKEEFPCHLILNGNYRHHFRPATASYDDYYAKLNWLWKRLVTMIEYFDPAPVTQNIRLTPSVYGAVPLSEKAVPYYYKKRDGDEKKNLEELHKAWTGRKNKIGYWYGWYNESDASYLNYDLEQYNFVRIEGHIDKSYTEETIKKVITKIADDCHLPITVIALRETPSDREDCISESQGKIFVALQNSAKKSVSEVNNSIITESFLTSASKESQTALDVAEQAEQAAKSTGTVVEKIVKEAVQKVRTAVDLTKAANTTKTAATAIAAKKAAEAAITAMNEATKTAKSTTAESAVISAATATVAAAQKIATAAQAIQAKEAADAIGKEELNLELYLNSVDRITSTYENVFSFACQDTKLNDHCQKIISFLQWLDMIPMTYQRCEAKKVFSSFKFFHAQHPGLQHKSGVPIGGTFILVYDEKNTVIADFCLPYRVTQPD